MPVFSLFKRCRRNIPRHAWRGGAGFVTHCANLARRDVHFFTCHSHRPMKPSRVPAKSRPIMTKTPVNMPASLPAKPPPIAIIEADRASREATLPPQIPVSPWYAGLSLALFGVIRSPAPPRRQLGFDRFLSFLPAPQGLPGRRQSRRFNRSSPPTADWPKSRAFGI